MMPRQFQSKDASDTGLAGYPAGRISGEYKSRIPDIRPLYGRAIWYPGGYRISKRPDYPAGYPVHPYF
jgi:hypothetical protein